MYAHRDCKLMNDVYTIPHSFLSVEIKHLNLTQLHVSVTYMLLNFLIFKLHRCCTNAHAGVIKHNNLVLVRKMFRCFVAICHAGGYTMEQCPAKPPLWYFFNFSYVRTYVVAESFRALRVREYIVYPPAAPAPTWVPRSYSATEHVTHLNCLNWHPVRELLSITQQSIMLGVYFDVVRFLVRWVLEQVDCFIIPKHESCVSR